MTSAAALLLLLACADGAPDQGTSEPSGTDDTGAGGLDTDGGGTDGGGTDDGGAVETDTGTDDEVLPGDSVQTAIPLDLDADGSASVTDAIEEPGDRDFYAIPTQAGQVVAVYTASDIYDQDSMPDTVLRVYDGTGSFLFEQDDFAYWTWGTDSGLFVQDPTGDGLIVEVLEWGDWSWNYEGSGGADWTYELHVETVELDDFEWGDNDDASQAAATYALASESSTDELGYDSWLFEGAVPESQDLDMAQVFGEIETPGDVDWWVIEVTEEDVGQPLMVSFWQDYVGELAPVLSLVGPSGQLLGQTTAPGYVLGSANAEDWTFALGSRVWGHDSGITILPREAGTYYAVVEDQDGTGAAGAGYLYPLVFARAAEPALGLVEEGDGSSETAAARLAVQPNCRASPIIRGLWSCWFDGTFAGALDSPEDTVDRLELANADLSSGYGSWNLSSHYLSVYVETELHGSQLDALVTVYEDVDGSLVELATASLDPTPPQDVDNPAIHDLKLQTNNDLVIEITHESGAESADASHFYFGRFVLHGAPVN